MSKQAIRLVALTELEIDFLTRVCQDSDRDRAPRVFRAALDRDVTPHLPAAPDSDGAAQTRKKRP